ncbi:hypothetical protein [Streptomyces antimicrobicus]|uniref:Uncharacterized protein n=1 Tax=Streptomyces antimicrobicus TaxID=2883108 RepID=A0ABS8B581_9ACTN|nr:hypothetical protein [Streptomyces antimicrobicus]MCB5179775.1 hypothetical protein [Streptomyces antimicrobicus]
MRHESESGAGTAGAGGDALTTEDLANPGTSNDTGTDMGTGTGAGADTDTGTDTALDTGAGSATGTDTGSGTGSGTAVYPGEATAYDRDDVSGTGGSDDSAEGSGGGDLADEEPLMSESRAADFRDQWSNIQGGFVDDPKEAVHAADALVASVMQHLASSFAEHKESLEKQWQSGEEVATEDLRLALQRYRSFFNRLLST